MTSREIEDVLHISARTIDTWSRTRDDKHLLARFLKSFSKYEIADRIKEIIVTEKLTLKSEEELFNDLIEPLCKMLEESGLGTVNKKQLVVDDRETFHLAFTDDSVVFIDWVPQLMSKTMFASKLQKIAEKLKQKDKIVFVLIAPKTSATSLQKIDLSLKKHDAYILGIDTVAKMLYGIDKILIV